MFGYFKNLEFSELFDLLTNRAKEPEAKADGSNSSLFFARVSPAENQSFVRNEAGWIRNDLDLMMSLENENVAMSVMNRLQEIQQTGFKSDESPDVIRLSLMSKYQQTEAEVTNWIEGQLEFQELKEEQDRLAADKKLSDEQRVARLKEFKENLTSEERDLWLKSKRAKLIDKMLVEEEEELKGK